MTIEIGKLSGLERRLTDENKRLNAEIDRLRTALDTLDKNLQLQQWSIRVSLGTLKR